MDLSETISSVYTPAVGTRRAWASWPAGSGGDGALWVTSVHKWLPIRKRSEGGREGWGRQRGRVEEVQYLVLLNLWEGSEDTRRHQLNMFCISEQFLWCWWRRGGGEEGEEGDTTQCLIQSAVSISLNQACGQTWAVLRVTSIKSKDCTQFPTTDTLVLYYRKHKGEKSLCGFTFVLLSSSRLWCLNFHIF